MKLRDYGRRQEQVKLWSGQVKLENFCCLRLTIKLQRKADESHPLLPLQKKKKKTEKRKKEL